MIPCPRPYGTYDPWEKHNSMMQQALIHQQQHASLTYPQQMPINPFTASLDKMLKEKENALNNNLLLLEDLC
ncbi:MAG: hypothetical protein AB7O96_00915 [Pseudobdellovibrionaceae bacterium]